MVYNIYWKKKEQEEVLSCFEYDKLFENFKSLNKYKSWFLCFQVFLLLNTFIF